MKWFLEIIQNIDGTYYANMTRGGKDSCGIYHDPKAVEGLPEYVDYKTLSEAIKEKTGVSILKRKELYWSQKGNKKYSYMDCTQYRGIGKDCRVTLEEMQNGHKPNFD